MSKRWIKAGIIDQTIDIFVLDSSSTTGAGLTGLTNGTSGLTCYYRKGQKGSAQQLTLASQTVGGDHADGGFVAIDGTNMPGLYRLDLSDTMVAAEGMLTIYLRGATNMAPVVAELEIVDVDIYDSVRMGLTALPNAAAEASGGLATLSAAQASNGTIPVNIKTIAGQTASAAAGVTFPSSIGTSTLTAQNVWDYSISGYTTAGLAGTALLGAGSAGDPWSTALPGSYADGTAGKIIGTRIDAAISTRLASGNVTVGGFSTGAITSTAFAAGAITASEISNDAAQEIANAVWSANITTDYAISPATSAAWANNTFGDRVIRSTGNNHAQVQITGSNHVAADVHEFQQGVITAVDFAEDSIDANALAASAAGEIADAVWDEQLSGHLTAGSTGEALDDAGGGGPGGGSTTVRMGPFTVKAEGQASDLPLDINKGATHGIDCKLVDAQGTGVDLTGATLSTKVYSTSGTLVATISGTATYEAGGDMTWTIPTSVTNTAGTYTATITRTTGASDTEVFGPLRIYVRDI